MTEPTTPKPQQHVHEYRWNYRESDDFGTGGGGWMVWFSCECGDSVSLEKAAQVLSHAN